MVEEEAGTSHKILASLCVPKLRVEMGFMSKTFRLALMPCVAWIAVGCSLQPEVRVEPQRLRGTVEGLVGFGTRHTLSDQASEKRGVGAAARWLKGEMEKLGAGCSNWRVEEQVVHVTERTSRIPEPVRLENVLGVLEGIAPQEQRRVIVVSGHYDSRVADVMDATSDAPGANDDASGVAVVLEAARVLVREAKSRGGFRHTVVFAAVSGEEQGLTGATALAARAKEEGWSIEMMITNDIVGNTRGGSGLDGRGKLRVFSEGVPAVESSLAVQNRQTFGGENDGPSRQLSRYIEEQGETHVRGMDVIQTWRRDRYGRGGDHIPFLRQGFPAVRLTEMYENFSRQHVPVTKLADGRREGDLPEYVDYAYLAQVAQVNIAAIREMASAPASPRVVWIDPGLSYDTVLGWEKVPGAVGYAIRARSTTAATWEKRIDVGNVNQITLKDFSKDDWMYGVEAYDTEGNRSVAVVPVPRRSNAGGTTRPTR